MKVMVKKNQSLEDEVTLKLDEKQASAVSFACELTARLLIGQTDQLNRIISPKLLPLSREDEAIIKKILFPELSVSSSYGIHSPEISDNARKMFDIHQVLRHYLTLEYCKKNNTTPSGVSSYEPSQTSMECKLPELEKNNISLSGR